MKSYTAALIILISTLWTVACGRGDLKASSSAGALTANSSTNDGITARPFGKHTLSMGGAAYLNEFIRPDVRAKLDEEPVGDADGGFDPATVDQGFQGAQSSETSGESPAENPADAPGNDEANLSGDTLKYAWAKKAFGDAVKANPDNNGVIVLYADENFFDVSRMMGFVEEGRNHIAKLSDIGGERIQVVFGGYRAVPQVELWVVTEGAGIPEFKPDDRTQHSESEN
jgi:hypothetical protein